MRFSPARFSRLLNGLGQSFLWRPAAACPCINPHSGAARHDCPLCSGKGRVWGAGVEGSAGVVSRDQMLKIAQFGQIELSDLMISIPHDSPLYALGPFDRLLARQRTEPFSLNVVRGLNDTLRIPAESVSRVFWVDGQGQARECDVPTIGADGELSWSAGAVAPPAGMTYSVTGRAYQEFFVYLDLPADRPMHHGAKLPRRVVLRRFDLLGR